MKKLSILLATILVFTLAVPALGANFPDISSDHWAYDAVNKLVAAGILEGFPDGTFRPDETFKREQMAVVVSRLLVKINEESDAFESSINQDIDSIEDELDNLASGLTTQQAQDVEAIIKTLMEKDDSDGLTEEEAAEVTDLIEKLTQEFEADIYALRDDFLIQKEKTNLRFEDLEEQINEQYTELVDEMNQKIKATNNKVDVVIDNQNKIYNQLTGQLRDLNKYKADKEAVESRLSLLENEVIDIVDPTYSLSYKDVGVEGAGTPYKDPFNNDLDGDGTDEIYDEDSDSFTQELGFDLSYEKDAFAADLTFNAVVENFISGNSESGTSVDVDNVKGTISGENFTATMDSDQDVFLKEYLYESSDDDAVNGVVAEIYDDTYLLDFDGVDGVDADHSVFAGEHTKSLFGQDLNFAFGIENAVDVNNRNILMGVDTVFDIAGITITPEFAVSNMDFSETLFTLNAVSVLGPLATSFTFEQDRGLDVIEAPNYSQDDNNGYKFSVNTIDSFDFIDFSGTYENYYNLPVMRMDIAKSIIGINNSFAYDRFMGDGSSRMQYEVDTTRNFAGISLTGMLNWINYNDFSSYETNQLNYDSDFSKEGVTFNSSDTAFDKTLKAKYSLGNFSARAIFVHDILGTLTHEYGLDYAQGIFSAGIAKYLNQKDDATILTAGLNAEKEYSYDLMAIAFTPYASFGYKMDNTGSYTNMVAGLEAEKDLTSKATLIGGFEYADKAYDVDIAGTKLSKNLGISYDVTDDISADLDYENVNFDADSGAGDSYEARSVTGSVGVSF